MARISSETLFNFTDNIDHLIDNLKNGFYCHNTSEKLPGRNNYYQVPMTCFCDIPLSVINEHFDWYGRFGIGIKRSYARELGVKPVWYVTSESKLVKEVIKNGLGEHERKHLLPYIKPFMGNQNFPPTDKTKRKKFYDEREWRYIPSNALVRPIFGVKANREADRSEPFKGRMKLNFEAIEYIIIESDDDFERLLDELKPICEERGIKYESMIAKIMTSKQIERDF